MNRELASRDCSLRQLPSLRPDLAWRGRGERSSAGCLDRAGYSCLAGVGACHYPDSTRASLDCVPATEALTWPSEGRWRDPVDIEVGLSTQRVSPKRVDLRVRFSAPAFTRDQALSPPALAQLSRPADRGNRLTERLQPAGGGVRQSSQGGPALSPAHAG